MSQSDAPQLYPYSGHDRGIVLTQPRPGEFEERPMTAAERAAREPAYEIARNIYKHANQAGVCYYEFWKLISQTVESALRAAPPSSKAVAVRCRKIVEERGDEWIKEYREGGNLITYLLDGMDAFLATLPQETPPQPASEAVESALEVVQRAFGNDWNAEQGAAMDSLVDVVRAALRANGGTAKVPEGMALVPRKEIEVLTLMACISSAEPTVQELEGILERIDDLAEKWLTPSPDKSGGNKSAG